MSLTQQLIHAPNTWQAFKAEYGLENRPVVAFGFNLHWRGTLASFVQGEKLLHTKKVGNVPVGAVVLVWGNAPLIGLPSNCLVVRLEDGFLRSVGLGAEFARPVSWVLDFDSLYFDATGPSRMEKLLNVYEFSDDERNRAQNLLRGIRRAGLTKYNTGHELWRRPLEAETIILVPGQVESDASIKFGSPVTQTNLSLLQQVRENNPHAWIVYKPHPDVIAGARKAGVNEGEAHFWCDEVVKGVSMDVLLDQVDEVHTMTSLAGFEALIRGKRVTCYGLPFYAGWGLTSDKLNCPRRSRQLSLLELAHAVLIQYPLYVSRGSKKYITPEQALNQLQDWREMPLPLRDSLKKTARKAINLICGQM